MAYSLLELSCSVLDNQGAFLPSSKTILVADLTGNSPPGSHFHILISLFLGFYVKCIQDNCEFRNLLSHNQLDASKSSAPTVSYVLLVSQIHYFFD